ncbi:hypothetical protein ACFL2K_02615 [Candidatus Margulisiibacteriota bacterium]
MFKKKEPKNIYIKKKQPNTRANKRRQRLEKCFKRIKKRPTLKYTFNDILHKKYLYTDITYIGNFLTLRDFQDITIRFNLRTGKFYVNNQYLKTFNLKYHYYLLGPKILLKIIRKQANKYSFQQYSLQQIMNNLNKYCRGDKVHFCK